MFQDGSDGIPTDSPQTLVQTDAGRPPPGAEAVVEHCEQSSPVETSAPNESARVPAGLDSSVPRPANTSVGYNTLPPRRTSYLPTGLKAAREPVVALGPRKVHSLRPATEPGPVSREG